MGNNSPTEFYQYLITPFVLTNARLVAATNGCHVGHVHEVLADGQAHAAADDFLYFVEEHTDKRSCRTGTSVLLCKFRAVCYLAYFV